MSDETKVKAQKGANCIYRGTAEPSTGYHIGNLPALLLPDEAQQRAGFYLAPVEVHDVTLDGIGLLRECANGYKRLVPLGKKRAAIEGEKTEGGAAVTIEVEFDEPPAIAVVPDAATDAKGGE